MEQYLQGRLGRIEARVRRLHPVVLHIFISKSLERLGRINKILIYSDDFQEVDQEVSRVETLIVWWRCPVL